MDNKATATTNEGGSHSATASLPMIYKSAVTNTKDTFFALGTTDTADIDTISLHAALPICNISLTGTSVSDQVEAYAGTSVSGPASGDNGNGILDVGETIGSTNV